jgi:tellurite resistance protein TehA-like permease
MGLAALISVASYALTSNLGTEIGALLPIMGVLRYLFWGISTVLIGPVVFLTILKIRKSGKIRFSASLWSVVFPTAVYSYDTYLVSRSLFSESIYETSLIFDLFSMSLFLMFWILFFIFPSNK